MEGQAVKSGPVSANDNENGEDVLLDRARTGDMTACALLMRRYSQRLYRAIRSVLKTGVDVEDTMQDTYLAALRNLDRFEGRAQFGTWLLRIGTNAALARRRQTIRAVQLHVVSIDDLHPMLNIADDATRTPEHQVSNCEIASIIEEAIDKLPDDYRQVFMLRTIEGLDTTETAEALGIGEDAVRQRLHRAREALFSESSMDDN